jgi:hypothetical protein
MITLMMILATLMTSCTSGPCRQLRRPDLANSTGVTPTMGQKTSTPPAPPQESSPSDRQGDRQGDRQSGLREGSVVGAGVGATVFVYKPDGSLQCGAAKGLAALEMEKKELRGIKVISRDKRPDGLMHIQVCGSPTGMINVYEIPSASLAEAEKRGFKKLEAP